MRFRTITGTNSREKDRVVHLQRERAAILAGGSDILSMMKDHVEGPKLQSPQHLIDIRGIKELNYIKEHRTGLKIGAATTLNEIASSALVSSKYPLLASAASQVGYPRSVILEP